MEQRQLARLITWRSWVRIPPPLSVKNSAKKICDKLIWANKFAWIFHQHIIKGCSSTGRAAVSKTAGCGFKSCRPCVCGRSSVVERLLAKEKVVSSNLIARSLLPAEVAQLVEHLTENQRVPSSSLGLGTLLGDRLMVGQRPLEPYIQVRILVSQLGYCHY